MLTYHHQVLTHNPIYELFPFLAVEKLSVSAIQIIGIWNHGGFTQSKYPLFWHVSARGTLIYLEKM